MVVLWPPDLYQSLSTHTHTHTHTKIYIHSYTKTSWSDSVQKPLHKPLLINYLMVNLWNTFKTNFYDIWHQHLHQSEALSRSFSSFTPLSASLFVHWSILPLFLTFPVESTALGHKQLILKKNHFFLFVTVSPSLSVWTKRSWRAEWASECESLSVCHAPLSI